LIHHGNRLHPGPSIKPPTRGQRFFRFAIVGLIGIAVQLGALFCLTAWGLHYLPASTLAVEIAILHNFVWHARWTWRDRKMQRLFARLADFNLASGTVSLTGNLLLMPLFVAGCSLDLLISNLLAVAICSLVNFFMADRLVFRGKTADPVAQCFF
jgi:dolichol-phosphate mannosyltransferase